MKHSKMNFQNLQINHGGKFLKIFLFIHEPEKVKGRIHNSSLWNELKDVKKC